MSKRCEPGPGSVVCRRTPHRTLELVTKYAADRQAADFVTATLRSLHDYALTHREVATVELISLAVDPSAAYPLYAKRRIAVPRFNTRGRCH